jgi:uncharacterized membrane protein YeaQ/YmgE (transglycosylase-associated protein family)/uncharacterized protein YjbJ (UPF0337 family)
MNPIIWLLVGAATGWLTSIVIHRRRSAHLFNILVGMGGAFVTGYLIYPMLPRGPVDQGVFSRPALLVSLGGAVFLLLVVNFFRREKDVQNEEFERRWPLVSNKIHTRWGKLTDEDVARIDGNYIQFIAMLKARYGCSDGEARDQIQRYLKAILVDFG